MISHNDRPFVQALTPVAIIVIPDAMRIAKMEMKDIRESLPNSRETDI